MTAILVYRWGRGRGHRIQHAWSPWNTEGELRRTLCGQRVMQPRVAIDFDSDAARCERCAAEIKRQAT